ncbi:MAG: hypothetical protein IT285_05855 [Bdellovibrionales bacterium]|nr:hypothetical protein [Bdellovibrionales bacterium]
MSKKTPAESLVVRVFGTPTPLRLGAGAAIVVALSAAAAYFGPESEAAPAWTSILPPVLAVTLAFVTQRILTSLALAILAGGLLSGSVATAPQVVFKAVSDPFNLKVLLFITLILAMISVVIAGGGLRLLVDRLAVLAKGPRSAQAVTALMGVLIFIDDYANTMIVGSAMKPATDRYKVSREKLAFLVDATSAPVAGLAVVSTWIGYEVGLFGKVSETLNLGKDGYSMFFDALSFRFYCILLLVFLALQIFTGRDFGPMLKAERRARKTGKVSADGARLLSAAGFAAAEPEKKARLSAWTAFAPFVVLFAVLFGGLWADGGGMAGAITDIFSFSRWKEVISASENNVLVLAWAGGVSLVVAAGSAVLASKLPPSVVGLAAFRGAKASLLPMLILVLAWSLKGACDAVRTGDFLIAVVGNSLSPAVFPMIVFLTASATAFATGTSWGTMAILIPTAIPIAHQLDGGSYGLTTIICLGAVLDGAIFGDHCSPISDTTLMSSIASSCDHIDHVRTQLPYALVVGLVAIVAGYLPAAQGMPLWASLGIGIGAMWGTLRLVGQKVD